jgi:hypothetical protein
MLHVALALAAYGLAGSAASAMNLSEATAAAGHGRAVLLEGEIVGGDTEQLSTFLRAHDLDYAHVTLVLNSPGGNILEAEGLAELIRGHGMAVEVLDGQMCASACFLLFAASRDKSAAPGAMIGVHSASLFGDENLITVGVTTMMAREAAAFDVPPDVIGRMVTTEPSKMAWLTDAELKEMKVHILPAQAAPEEAPQEKPAYVAASGFGANGVSQPSLVAPDAAPSTNGTHVTTTTFTYRPADFAMETSGAGHPALQEPALNVLENEGSARATNSLSYTAIGLASNPLPNYIAGASH